MEGKKTIKTIKKLSQNRGAPSRRSRQDPSTASELLPQGASLRHFRAPRSGDRQQGFPEKAAGQVKAWEPGRYLPTELEPTPQVSGILRILKENRVQAAILAM